MSDLQEHLADLAKLRDKKHTIEWQALVVNMVNAHLDELFALAASRPPESAVMECVIEACAKVCDNRLTPGYGETIVEERAAELKICAKIIRSLDRANLKVAAGRVIQTGHELDSRPNGDNEPLVTVKGSIAKPVFAAPYHLSEAEQRALKKALLKSSAAAPEWMPEEAVRFSKLAIHLAGDKLGSKKWVREESYDTLRSHAETLQARVREAESWRLLQKAAQQNPLPDTPEAIEAWAKRLSDGVANAND